MPHLTRRAVLGIGFLFGLALWLIPVQMMGLSRPWDGNGPGYPLALLSSGLLLGFLAPTRPGAAAAGVFLGQLAFLLWRVVVRPENGELWLVSVVFLAGYTFVVTGVGALLAGLLRRRLAPGGPTERSGFDRRS